METAYRSQFQITKEFRNPYPIKWYNSGTGNGHVLCNGKMAEASAMGSECQRGRSLYLVHLLWRRSHRLPEHDPRV